MSYPITLNLNHQRVLVIGGGSVATRKVNSLLLAGAAVYVVSPTVTPTLRDAIDTGRITYRAGTYRIDDLTAIRPLLVFAVTDQPDVNQQITDDARRSGVLVNRADDATQSDFNNMATLTRPPLTIAIASGGASPALVRELKQWLDDQIGDEYAILARWLGEHRNALRDTVSDQPTRAETVQAIVQSDILTRLRAGDIDGARQRFDELSGVMA